MTYTIRTSQLVPAGIDEVWTFFSRPENLGRITPASMGFAMEQPAPDLSEGSLIEYTIRPLLGIPAQWRTRIDAWDPPHRFRDIQVHGPYRRWVHTHTLTAVDGGTRVDDVVDYELPFGPLGRLVHGWLVRPELDRIFAYRRHAIDAIFEPVAAATRASADGGIVAVAGGTGFVGRAIARELRRRGRSVVAISSRGEAARGELPDDIEIRQADVTTGAGLAAALAGVQELVIALAFRGSPIERPKAGATFMAVDAAGTERLVVAAAAAGLTRVVYISGAGAAPDARRHWFRAKWRAEEAVRGSGLTWTIIRPTWIYGPGDVALNRFLGFGRRLPFVPMTSFGRQLLAPVFIDDTAKLAADSLEAPAAADQVFELGGPETLTMREIIRRALLVAGLRRLILPAPAVLVRLAAVPLQLLPRPPLSPDAVVFINQPATVDLAPLQARMPRRLTPLMEGLATYLGPTPPGDRPVQPASPGSATR
jgi:NADH dehydrogenase